MEQKKILWIIASVGVFLLVVMGAALIINRPAQGVEPALASLQSPNDTWVMTPANTTPAQATDSFQTQGQLVDGALAGGAAVDGAAQSGQAAASGEVDSMTVYSGTTNVYGSAGTTTIDLNSIKEAVQQATVTATNQAGAHAVASAKTPAAVQAPAKEEVKSAATTPSKTPAKATTAKAESKKLVDQYWVQVASVTNKNNAENARKALAANKIESEIFTHRGDDGKLYYRLRVGPYTTKTEAEYWQGRIVLIEEFADTKSYITNTNAQKK